MLELNLYRNKMTTSKGYGMIYGRVENDKPMSIEKHQVSGGVEGGQQLSGLRPGQAREGHPPVGGGYRRLESLLCR